MTDVRIRREWQGRPGVSIGDVPFLQVDDVIRQLCAWGISHNGDTVDNKDDMFGEFVVENGQGYFEVVIGE